MALTTTNAQALRHKAKLFNGLADLSRLAILETLRDGPLSVGEVVVATGLSQSNVSNHLACLFDCGLVTREQRGRYVYYHLSDDRVATLLELSDGLLADAAQGFYDCTRYAVRERNEA
jgi:ArsR family transcriptional regulator, cadmium/lead-responsive transcriptional repressor